MSYQPSRRPDISYGSYQPNYPNIPSAKPIPTPIFNTGRLPSGGGRLNPLMARNSPTSYGSYPPRSTTREELIPTREHSIRSYNQNSYGDFSPSRYPRASTAPMYDDPGYKRQDDYPRGSRMDREYNSYKAIDDASGNATTAYKDEAARLQTHPRVAHGVSYGQVKGKYFYPEDHAALAPLARAGKDAMAAYSHNKARTQFNHDHIGRVERDKYRRHDRAAIDADNSRKKHALYERQHDTFSTKKRFP